MATAPSRIDIYVYLKEYHSESAEETYLFKS